jgi:hypothetical protein
MGNFVSVMRGPRSWTTKECRTLEEALSFADRYAGSEALIIDEEGNSTTLPMSKRAPIHRRDTSLGSDVGGMLLRDGDV